MHSKELLAGEKEIKAARPSYKVGMYFTLCIILLVALWAVISEVRWLMLDSGVGNRFMFDSWMVLGAVFIAVMTGLAFCTLGFFSSGWTKECAMLGGMIHLEERQIVAVWAAIIGVILGMGFWDIVTEINLAVVYGIMNIWNINVIVFDFGIWQMVLPVWAVAAVGTFKMGSVTAVWILAVKNVRRGTICELAGLDKSAVFSSGPSRIAGS